MSLTFRLLVGSDDAASTNKEGRACGRIRWWSGLPRIISVDFDVPPPAGAGVVDLGSATLVPGLVDTHMHLACDATADPVGSLAARSDAEKVAAMRRAARTALTGGWD